ncbi:MAG: hypothetical protein KMY55_16785 [Dethiosulfatibacter sp.]|nr:hypothetical protein [Dethiosulfatibacter sp.]
MRRDKIYEDLIFSDGFSADDWNVLIKQELGKYLTSDTMLKKNKDLLKIEIINYIKLHEKPEYLSLFEWMFDFYKECFSTNKERTIRIFAESFYDISKTDSKWMTNVLIQTDTTTLSERDRITCYFDVIDDTLEGVFKPRFMLLDKLVKLKLNQTVVDNSCYDFGNLIRNFPSQFKNDVNLLLKDPIFLVSTNQWRNIASHKSYTINTDNILVKYGKGNSQSLTISNEDFYRIVYWTQDIYKSVRLAQTLICLNYMEEIAAELGEEVTVDVRFESSLLHIVHNLQIVGFEFDSTEELSEVFCLNVKGKINHDVVSSLAHASQCLDQLSSAIFDDEYVRGDFKRTQICIVDENQNMLGTATIPIEIAMKKLKDEISLDEYLDKMVFEIKAM